MKSYNEYWKSVQSTVDCLKEEWIEECVDRIRSSDGDMEQAELECSEEMRMEWEQEDGKIHEWIDGTTWTTYYSDMLACLHHSSNDNEIFEHFGKEAFASCESMGDVYTQAAYWALHCDVTETWCATPLEDNEYFQKALAIIEKSQLDKVSLEHVREIQAVLQDWAFQVPSPGRESLDFRIQMQDDGSTALHIGDAQYDTDHAGHWGAGSVLADDGFKEIKAAILSAMEDAHDSKVQAEV